MRPTATHSGLSPSGTRAEDRRFTLIILLGATAVYLYLNLYVLPGTPVLLSGDQLFFWMDGQRILHHELPYRDFFQFTPPGADLVYFAVFKVLGSRIWAINAVVLVLGVALCWVCFETARRLVSRGLAVLAALLFLTLIYSRLLNATHHWFSVLAIMTAVVILMRGTNHRRLALSGALLGIATFFTQSHGVVALLAISLFLKSDIVGLQSRRDFWNNEKKLLTGYFIALLSLNAYFIARVGLRQLFYCQVYYVFRVMVRPALLGIPVPPSWQTPRLATLVYEYAQYFFVYAMLPISYVLALRRSWRKPGNSALRQPEVALLAMVGFSLLGEVILSINWLRVYTVSMAGVILFIYLLNARVKARRYLLAAVWIAVAGLAVQRVWSTQRHDYGMAELPAGRCATDAAEHEKLTWVMQHTKPGDFLFEAGWPGVYIPLALRNPVFLDTAGTMLNQAWAKQAVQQLDARQVRYILWVGRLDYPIDPRHPRTALIVPLRDYLHASYRVVHVFPDGEQAWERK